MSLTSDILKNKYVCATHSRLCHWRQTSPKTGISDCVINARYTISPRKVLPELLITPSNTTCTTSDVLSHSYKVITPIIVAKFSIIAVSRRRHTYWQSNHWKQRADVKKQVRSKSSPSVLNISGCVTNVSHPKNKYVCAKHSRLCHWRQTSEKQIRLC